MVGGVGSKERWNTRGNRGTRGRADGVGIGRQPNRLAGPVGGVAKGSDRLADPVDRGEHGRDQCGRGPERQGVHRQETLSDQQPTSATGERGEFEAVGAGNAVRRDTTTRQSGGGIGFKEIVRTSGTGSRRGTVSAGMSRASAGRPRIEITRFTRGDGGRVLQPVGEDIGKEVAAGAKAKDGGEGKGHRKDSMNGSGIGTRL